jgi:hypothetical protein
MSGASGAMAHRAWPFLVSRNLDVDYRTVVIAEFLAGSVLEQRLASQLDVEPGKDLRYADIETPGVGPLTALYRVVPAELSGGRVFRDRFGRTICWVEGLVMEGAGIRMPGAARIVEAAHEALVDAFLRFWDGALRVQPSCAIAVERAPEEVAAPTTRRASVDTPASRRANVAVVLTSIATFVVFCATVVLFGLPAIRDLWGSIGIDRSVSSRRTVAPPSGASAAKVRTSGPFDAGTWDAATVDLGESLE